MKAVCFIEKGKVAVEDRPKPTIREATDAVVRITTSAICGSDLHFYHGRIPVDPGFVVGHEMLGIVEDVGQEVRTIKPGDRVVVTDIVGCGHCWYCRRRHFTNCVKKRIFGMGTKLGDLPGGQAEFVRVPWADTSCGIAPAKVSDDAALFVGDILVTGYTGARNGNIQPGDTVVVVGCGPVGLLAQICARLYGPAQVLAVDMVPARLAMAKDLGSIPIDGTDGKAARGRVKELTEGRGADVTIEAVGGGEAPFHAACFFTRPKGAISVIGAHSDRSIGFPAVFAFDNEWTIRFGAGDSPRYREEVFALLETGRLQPEKIVSHHLSLEEAPHGYEIFARREAFKIILNP